ncbi:MAG: TetR/AcrR family transcriptional regulator [Oscillibacter sp.]|nr:TetR/AcrR family transcriptional regulator [Oscillibacter sp.]
MCTETFLRLPEEKRNRFLDAAWEEFTVVPYAKASINQIVRRAGIPRGSFYQYFEDKSDLFNYLMENVRDQVVDLFHDILCEAEGDLFRTALLAFDRFQDRRRTGDQLLFNRFVQLLHINPGVDLESTITGRPEEYITGEFWQEIDLSRLRRTDEHFLLGVCRLIGGCLGGALMDCLLNADRETESRQGLAEQLDIVRRGACRPELFSQVDAM